MFRFLTLAVLAVLLLGLAAGTVEAGCRGGGRAHARFRQGGCAAQSVQPAAWSAPVTGGCPNGNCSVR
jgi:hypothetical protein